MANTYLERTVGTPDTNGNKKATFSAWVKRSKIGTEQAMYVSRTSGTNFVRFRFDSDAINVTSNTSGTNYYATTDAVYRDCNGWYHVVVAYDTTQATAANRIRIYVNGVEQSKSASNYPSQDATIYLLDSGNPQRVGANSSDAYFDGLMSHVHYTEGYAYAASDFGSTDSDTGEWKINTSPSVSYGTNGFFWLKDDVATTDHSSNSNTFTVGGGTLTKTEDCPSNIFATWNYLTSESWGGKTTEFNYLMSNGNTTFDTTGNANYQQIGLSTLGMTSGKYYMEIKTNTASRFIAGICNERVWTNGSVPYNNSNDAGLFYRYAPDIAYDTANYSTGITGISDGNILGFALDMDNKNWYIHVNGTYMKSGDPTSGASGTGSISAATSKDMFNHGEVFFCIADFSSSGSGMKGETNFGNGYFGTTAISSEGTNASGIGKFEYDVPTGYTALSTKGLNE